MTRVVGVDLGGTKIAAALVGPDGTRGVVATAPTPAADGPDAVLDAVAAAVARAAGDGGDGAALDAVGVGTAGAVDPARGVIVSTTDNFAGWLGTDLTAGLRARLAPGSGAELTVQVRNDVDAHALGEAWLGAAAGQASALVVAAGTGIGGAWLLDGRLRTGAHHHAGEIGHVPTPGAEGLRCPCGRDGHLEALAAGPAIWRRWRDRGADPAALGAVGDARAVFAAAGAGDALAASVIADAATGLGRAVAGLVTALDPAMVVVGGGLPQAGERWWRPFEEALRRDLVPVLAGLPVVPAALGPDAAILGAARAAYDALDDPDAPDESPTEETR